MQIDKKISLDKIDDIKILNVMQPNHFIRKSSMLSSILAMKIMFRKVPNYNLIKLIKHSKNISFKDNLKIFLGTLKRILKGKIK